VIARIALLSAVFLGSAHAAEPPSYDEAMARARDAFAVENWDALAAELDAAQRLRPYSFFVMRNRILAHEMKGDRARALQIVREIAERGLTVELNGHAAYDAVKGDPAFAEIAKQMTENALPSGERSVFIELRDDDWLPEAIAFSGADAGYVGGVRDGEIHNVPHGDAELFARGGVFDIEVRGRTLWAAVNNQLAYEKTGAESAFAAVAAFDLEMGAQTREIRLGEGDALIGDIEIGGDGVIYASDSKTPRIFRIDPADDSRAVSFTNPRYANLQGIALDEENSRLYVADYLTGLYAMDLETGEATLLGNDADAHLGGIDGLYLYDGDLIGVQNGTTPQRVVRMRLSKDGVTVRKFKVLAQSLPEWNEPTHGLVNGETFYYIATSNWPSYDAEKEWAVREDHPPQPLRIMAIELD
jgi:hypothetical protein